MTIINTSYLKRSYQINYAQALSKMKHRLASLIINKSGDIVSLTKQTIEYLGKTVEVVRKGRSYPRGLKNIKNDIYVLTCKNSL
jgi:hypothetical protein